MQRRRSDLLNYIKQKALSYISLCVVIVIICLCAPMLARAEASINWKGRFAVSEQQKLRVWISEVIMHVEMLVGPLPFEFRINIYRRDGARGPVPWAHTRRTNKPGVDFYVDPSYSLDTFRRDWTAAHEISHLILPYLGYRNAWFAEGFASFMQYEVMQSMGVLSKKEKVRRYIHSLSKASRDYAYPDKPFVQITARLRREGKYSVMYWGGAVYFLQINDYLLRTQKSTLIDVLNDYVTCCRRNFSSLYELIAELDQLTKSGLFASHLDRFISTRGFPKYGHLDLATEINRDSSVSDSIGP